MIMIPKFSKTKFFICISILFLVLQINGAFATETTISVSETEGQITVNAIATFTSYLECDVDDLSNCENIDSGTLRVFHNGIEIGIVEGNSTAQFSTTLDSSVMPQGENTFSANATDHMEIITNATEEVLVDNTPLITIAELGVVEGVFDIAGTATFKNHVGGFEGSIRIWIDGVLQGEKQYEGTNINWSYSEIIGQLLDAGGFEQGEHTVAVRAEAVNGEKSEHVDTTFFVDNTPFVTVNSPGVVTGSFDITGTATFKNHVGGFEGSVRIWIDGVSQGEKEYEGTNINWSYSEITGQTLESDNFEADEHTISVNARAANNEWSDNAVGTFIIE